MLALNCFHEVADGKVAFPIDLSDWVDIPVHWAPS